MSLFAVRHLLVVSGDFDFENIFDESLLKLYKLQQVFSRIEHIYAVCYPDTAILMAGLSQARQCCYGFLPTRARLNSVVLSFEFRKCEGIYDDYRPTSTINS